MFSSAYWFRANDRNYVIRLNDHREDFEKDALAFTTLQPIGVPIPKIIKIGSFDHKTNFCISEYCEGMTLTQLNIKKGVSAERSMAFEIFRLLEQIKKIDVSHAKGWGLTNKMGHGNFSSWPDYLLSLYNQKFDYDWHTLSQTTFLDAKVFAACLGELRRLTRYCPTQKWLVHGDFGFENVITDGNRITGVLDWAEMRLGDFLYDIANLDFWSKDVPYGDLWLEYARKQRWEVRYFDERMRCYMLYIGLSGMVIAAVQNDERTYRRVRERTRSVFGPGRRSSTDWTH